MAHRGSSQVTQANVIMSLHPPPKQKTILFYFYSLLLPGYGGGGGGVVCKDTIGRTDIQLPGFSPWTTSLLCHNLWGFTYSTPMCRYAILRLQYSELLALSPAINNCWTPRDGVAVIVLCWLLVWLWDMELGDSLQTQWVGISDTLPCPWYSAPHQTNKIHSYSYNVKYVKRTLNGIQLHWFARPNYYM